MMKSKQTKTKTQFTFTFSNLETKRHRVISSNAQDSKKVKMNDFDNKFRIIIDDQIAIQEENVRMINYILIRSFVDFELCLFNAFRANKRKSKDYRKVHEQFKSSRTSKMRIF